MSKSWNFGIGSGNACVQRLCDIRTISITMGEAYSCMNVRKTRKYNIRVLQAGLDHRHRSSNDSWRLKRKIRELTKLYQSIGLTISLVYRTQEYLHINPHGTVRGVLHLLPQKAPKLACFVLYLKIIDIFLKNNICILYS